VDQIIHTHEKKFTTIQKDVLRKSAVMIEDIEAAQIVWRERKG
jgi:hypothetical protein